MDIINLFLVVVFFANLVLGYLVVRRNFHNILNRQYFFNILGILSWIFFIIVFRLNFNGEIYLWSKFLYASAAALGGHFLFFTLIFPRPTKPYRTQKIAIFTLTLFLSLISLFTNLIVREAHPVNGGENSLVFGSLYYFYVIFILCSFSGGFLILNNKLKKSLGLEKQQIIFLLVGYSISANLAFITNLLLPSFGYFQLNWLGQVLTVVNVSFTVYAIMRYRLMDIRVAIKRSAIFTMLVLFITSIFSISAYLFTTFIQELIGKNSILLSGVITGIIVAIGFEPIKRFLTNSTDSFLFKGEYKIDELLGQLSADFSSSLNLKTILSKSSNALLEALRIKGISVYLYDKNKDAYTEKYFAGEHTAPIVLPSEQIERYLKLTKQIGLENSALVTEELKRLEIKDPDFLELIKLMEDNHVSVTLPLYLKDELIGFYFMDEKKSGDTFTTQDIQMLEIMSGQAAIAIENALLYEEQKKFTEKLQIEVDRATKELRSANKELKKLDMAKSEFISIASHQLRTPMTVIKGYISMVQQGDFGSVGEKLNKPLNAVMQSTNRLLTLIEDLLNISRIESGRMQYEFERTDLQEIVETVFEDLKNYAKTKNLEFEYHGPKEKLPDIIIDPKKIREVVMNLADNAIKYTPKGRVDVYLERNDGEIIYKVKDTGRGMSKEDIGKLFKKFSRVGGAQMVHTEGTGLGLYIAKQIIMKHNGKIWAESKGVEQGSTFAIALKVNSPKLEEELERQVKTAEEEAKKNQEPEYKEDTIDMVKLKSQQKNQEKK